MNERLRVGVIGCGEVTQILHLPSLCQLSEQFEVTALCDISREVLSGVGRRWSVTAQVLRYEEVLVGTTSTPYSSPTHTPITVRSCWPRSPPGSTCWSKNRCA